MRKLLTAVVITMLATISALAAEKRLLKPEDLMDEVSVGSPAVSPDGRWVAYSVNRYDKTAEKNDGDIFIVSTAGGTPRQLTATPGAESGYVWSPDGSKLAFAARREGKKGQIYVIDVGGGEARKLTSLDNGASSPEWSPDGAWLAFYSPVGQRYTAEQAKAFGDVRYAMHPRFYHLGPGWDDGSRQRIFVIPAAGGEAKQLTSGECADEGDSEMAWSPDSKQIAFVSNRSAEWWNTIDTNLYVADLASGTPRQLTTNPGPDHDPAWSPNGRTIAYRASFEYNYESENYKVLVMPALGGSSRTLTTKLDRNVRELCWAKDGQRIYFTASDQGESNLRWIDPAAPDVFHAATTGRQSISSVTPLGGDRFVVRRSTDVTPNEIYLLDRGVFTQLAREASTWWSQFVVQPSEELRLKAEDGTPLQGWLIMPAGYKDGTRVPLVLTIHGGPHGMYAPTLRSSTQLLAHAGYAVLYTNPRGSDGYGQAFNDAIVQDWHTKPLADVLRFVDRVVEMGIADPKRLGVTGGSYGGYLTNWLIGHCDRFAAAVSVAGIANVASFYGTTDEQFFIEKEMSGAPWQQRARDAYVDNSPLWGLANAKTPTMVVHGAEDWRVQPEQGRQLFLALQKVGVPSVYVEFPDEQHGVRGTKHVVVYQRLLLEWFDHWLQGKPVQLTTYITPRAYVFPPTPAK